MTDAIFLSASVPDPNRFPHYAETADAVAISAAVSALVHVALGRRMLIWGGHPAITPMIWVVAKAMNLKYGEWVKLYQSRFFEDRYPEDNKNFENVVFTDPIRGDQEESLLVMRRKMFKENSFRAGVFIGGMKGIIDEFNLFRDMQSKARLIPVVSTGGAVLELAQYAAGRDLVEDFDYVGLFHRWLEINPAERRYRSPKDQPSDIEARIERIDPPRR
jgi:SLOG cluster3 family